jgi:hypothetical protein
VRQIRMLRAMRRELETGLRRLLHGHARGNPDTAKEPPTDYRASSRPYQAPAPADPRSEFLISRTNKSRTRADATLRRWLASRSAPPAASSARRARAAPRPADRSDGGAVVWEWSVAARRVDAGVREFLPPARGESRSWSEARPAGRRTTQSFCPRREQSRVRNRSGPNTYQIFSRDSWGQHTGVPN